MGFVELQQQRKAPSRRKLLFLAHRFPPVNSSACIRSWNIAKHLARLGWEVTVISPEPALWRYIQNPSEVDTNFEKEGIRRILTGHNWRTLMPGHFKCRTKNVSWVLGGICRKLAVHFSVDPGIGWIKPVMSTCSTLSKNDADIILATGAPFISFRLAKALAKKLSCPYVIDYRDPWTGNPHRSREPRRSAVREEASILATAAAVTIVSPSWASAMDRRFSIGGKLHVVTNGYDPEEMASVQPVNFGHFAIVYAGLFYPPKRIISPVMAALKLLKMAINTEQPRWYFHYYGPHGSHVQEEARKLELLDSVILHGIVSRAEALSAMKGAGVNVAITSVAENVEIEDQGIITGKIFEMIGLGTPILVIAPLGSDVRGIARSSGDIRSFTGAEFNGMAYFLKDLICGIPKTSKKSGVYSWTHLATKFDKILSQTIQL